MQASQSIHRVGQAWQLVGDPGQAGRQLLTQAGGDVSQACRKTSQRVRISRHKLSVLGNRGGEDGDVEEGLIAAVLNQTKGGRARPHSRQVLVPFVPLLLLHPVKVVPISSLHSLMSSPLHRPTTTVLPNPALALNLPGQLLQRCLALKLAAAWSTKEAFIGLIPGKKTRI